MTPGSTGGRCFVEHDPSLSLARRAAAEGLGTLLLLLVASGGAAMAARAPAPFGVLLCAVPLGGALVGLIMALGAISGGHFNPLISGLQWLAGERSGRCALAYVGAQLGGAVLGALAGKWLTGGGALAPLPAPTPTLALSEFLASLGLMIAVLGCSRSGLRQTGPFAVGAWLTAAIVATPSGSYANPALTLAATLAGGPLALPLSTTAIYGAAQLAGALVALLALGLIAPRSSAPSHPARDKDSTS